jgi:methionyl aminopeptidase
VNQPRRSLNPNRPPPKLPRTNDPCWCGSERKYKKCHQEDDQTFLRVERVKLQDERVRPGQISAMRAVPPHIVRPDYAASGNPTRGSGRNVCTPDEIVRMRRACTAAANILAEAGKLVRPGITTDEIDEFVHERTIACGGYPSPLNYRGYPKSVCTSVNEVICHGIPDDRKLRDGDIVNLDVTVYLEGVHGDTNATFGVGAVDEESSQLIRITHECLMKGISAVRPKRPVSDIGREIELHAEAHGLGVVRDFCGHGIGETFHTNLQIPHYYDPAASAAMEVGMTFTIEPMITLGTWKKSDWDDGWTAVTQDLRRTAQFEHTILVTEQGHEILTVPG